MQNRMIVKYRATIPASKRFFRDYAFRDGMSLYSVMEFIQGQLGFVPDMMVLFQGIDSGGNVVHEYGLFDMGDGSIDNVTIADTLGREETVLRFIYNLSKNLYLDLAFVEECAADPKLKYPCVTDEKGHAPGQFSALYTDDDFEDRPHGLPKSIQNGDWRDDEDDDEDDEDEDDDEDGDDEDGKEVYDGEELP